MKKKHFVLGATGSIGYAYTSELLRQGVETEILVRNRNKAENLFQSNPLLTIHTGDVSDTELLRSLSRDADFIFHGINYPYHLWDKYMKAASASIIEAAGQNGATILFPGNIYAYGNIQEAITEEHIPKPDTRKGRLRYELEQMLEEASTQGRCKVINLRLPDFWGPNVTNGLIKPLLGNAASGKAVKWMLRADVPHQFAYTPDVARLFYRLTQEDQLPSYYVLNYGGTVMSSVTEFAGRISALAGSPHQLKLYSRRTLILLGWFVPVVRELKENFYQFENSIILDDSRMRSVYPDFSETSMDEAISETLNWFRTAT